MATPMLISFSSSVMKETSVDFGGKLNITPVELSQYDDSEGGTLTCIKITMYKNGELFYAPENVTIKIRFGMFGGYFAYYNALGFLSSRAVVIIPVRLQLTAVYGDYRPELEIVTQDGSTVASAPFSVKITKASVQLDYVAEWLKGETDIGEAFNYAKIAQEAAETAETSSTSAQQSAQAASASSTSAQQSAQAAENSWTDARQWALSSEDKAHISEGFAVGQKNGVDVPSTSPYYHNNAKWYSEHHGGYVTAGAKSGSTIATHATIEGYDNIGSAIRSHAEGHLTTASGAQAHAEGTSTEASGEDSHAEGLSTISSASASHAEGSETTASGDNSHAEGDRTEASGEDSHAEGTGTKATGTQSHAEGVSTVALATGSHAEGGGSKVTVDTAVYAHAEGQSTTSSAPSAHAEGQETTASADCAHAEGYRSLASGAYAHAEGESTTSGPSAHSEGALTQATAYASHAEGSSTVALAKNSHAEGGGSKVTVDTAECAHAEGYKTTASGPNSHSEGTTTTASGDNSHAEGDYTKATGEDAHAEGSSSKSTAYASHAEGDGSQATAYGAHSEGNSTLASGTEAHAEGLETVASGNESHAEGYATKARGQSSHAEGEESEANAIWSHAEGWRCIASGEVTHAEGYQATASGNYSHAEGHETTASGIGSHAGGYNTIAARDYETALGCYNDETSRHSSVTKLVIGSGTSSARSNCFRVEPDGVYATGAYNSSGADYAELFEWADGNIQNEDRAGKFVTLEGDKIRLATNSDDYIIGIVSGNASIVGDVRDDQWRGMYMHDVFGRPIFEEVEVEAEYCERKNRETGEIEKYVIVPAHTEMRQKLNPDYDNTQQYIPRTERPEWDAVGLLGKLIAIDDGTCQVNGWATVKYNSIATASITKTRYRVIDRIDESHVRLFTV